VEILVEKEWTGSGLLNAKKEGMKWSEDRLSFFVSLSERGGEGRRRKS